MEEEEGVAIFDDRRCFDVYEYDYTKKNSRLIFGLRFAPALFA
jgi:hypothetical protein